MPDVIPAHAKGIVNSAGVDYAVVIARSGRNFSVATWGRETCYKMEANDLASDIQLEISDDTLGAQSAARIRCEQLKLALADAAQELAALRVIMTAHGAPREAVDDKIDKWIDLVCEPRQKLRLRESA